MRQLVGSICYVIGASVAGACSPYSQHGEALYCHGRYIEAAEVFEVTEPRLREYPASARAEYGVYRGLTYLRLDDLYNARQWLGYALAMDRRDPNALDAYDRSQLAHGWAEFERRAATVPETTRGENRVATTDTAARRAPGPAISANGRRFIPAP